MNLPSDYKPRWDFKSQINNIRFLIQNPCAANPYIYLQTLVPVAGELALSWMSFGLSDILIGYTHPKPRRGWRRSSKEEEDRRHTSRDGEKRRLRGKSFPELGNEIGKKLPGSNWLRSRQLNQNAFWFWVPVDFAERGLFHFMVVDLARQGISNWSSDIYKHACEYHGPPPGPQGWYAAYTYSTLKAVPLTGNPNFQTGFQWSSNISDSPFWNSCHTKDHRNYGGWVSFYFSFGSMNYSGTLRGTWSLYGITHENVKFYIQRNVPFTVPPHQTLQLEMTGFFPPCSVVAYEMTHNVVPTFNGADYSMLYQADEPG
jgi:hypothetical protein